MSEKNIVLIGNFDGVHIGHQSLINLAQKLLKSEGGNIVVITFKPHPREVILGKKIDLIIPYAEKRRLLNLYGVDIIDEIEFNDSMLKMPSLQFANDFIINKYEPSHIIIGENFRFGHEAAGNSKFLEEISNNRYKVHSLNIQKVGSSPVSSTYIKQLLIQGDVNKVKDFLGRNYSMNGIVVKGEQRGREIGFPTTNLETDWQFFPKPGVYASYVEIDNKKHESITNIGFRPTFGNFNLQIESHIFNFNQQVYGKNITIEFLTRIRDEKKFETVEKLIENIKMDVIFAENYFKDLNI